MFGFGNFKALAAAAALVMTAGVAQAATVTTYCPNAVPNGGDSVRDFFVTIDNTNGPAGCVASGPGNDTNSPLVTAAIGTSTLLDKSTEPSVVVGVVFTVTGATSGAWSIALPFGYTLTNAFISFKSGEGGGDPDFALFSLPSGILAGLWGFDDTQCLPGGGAPRPTGCNGTQSLSHGSLYGKLVPTAVPLPAAGLMLLGALGGLAALRRRRKVA